MTSETLLMSNIFGESLAEDHISDSCNGISLREALEKAIDHIEAHYAPIAFASRNKKLVWFRYGLEDGRPRSLKETGIEFDISPERVRQIEAQFLRRLRHPSRSITLRKYIKQ